MALTTYEEIKYIVREETEQLTSTQYPEDLLSQFADSQVPAYYSEIAKQWTELPFEYCDKWQEIGAEGNATIFSLMSIDLFFYYEALYNQAFNELKQELEELEELEKAIRH